MAPSLPCSRLQRWLLIVAAAVLLLAAATTAWCAQRSDGVASYGFPALTGPVVDAANLLSPADEAKLTARSAALERRTGHQFVIATVTSLSGHPIEDYSLRLANHWGIGRKGVNDGIVLLVAPNERKVRIEVGYGLEKTVTNAEAARIIDADILPFFRKGELTAGIVHGVDAIVADLSETKS
ncbi:MAG: TPM domain-containing protein [Sphingomonas sp.]